MIRLLVIFLILLGSVWLGIQLYQDPGYLLIAVNNWTLETSLWVAVIGLILVFFLFHFLFLIFNALLNSPKSWRNWLSKRRAQKAQVKTRKGLIEFSEGYWAQAKNHLIKALPDTDTPLLNYLTAARAAQEMGDNNLRDEYLRQAQHTMPEAKIAVELTQAQLQLANHQWEQALATLRHLQVLAPQHPYVLKLLIHLYQELRDWDSLLKLLPELKIHQIITDKEIKELEKSAYLQGLTEMVKHHHGEFLNELVDTLPKSLRYDPDLMAVFGEYLISINEQERAEYILRKSLRREFNEKTIALYGMLTLKEKPLEFATSFLKHHPNSNALYLTLARLSQNENLWGKARAYYEESIQLKPTPIAYAELGLLLEKINDPTAACNAFKKGLLLNATSTDIIG
ncbi:protoporphyrinogen oxidase [Legionella adelaidensis]|uniref:Protoporphyrinogen oxidase n=1 Tax=Legionella adelaidensis TaxID=45056 RepID=A0A0W0R637_9GAMM|nr:heme biosynthesis HemY N-terminal domain-containing protein [Legionella adelaidensis]KTC66491.1 protoporphyrinogen oxidase [Legionella adelaidensis]